VNFSRAEIALLIRKEYDRSRGIPHRMGGIGKCGFDCSGFSQHVFARLFGVSLPRTTAVQASIGQRIKRSHLQAGDLVFFKPRSYPRHVGIYVGNGEFVHASASKGIALSRLDSRYWRRAYWTSRRVIVPAQEI
jgi:lipoprotein Spr/probable lipoprotein NlpC